MSKPELLLLKIRELGRLLNEEEIIEFYISHNTTGTCHRIQTVRGNLLYEETMWKIKPKAYQCYTYALGRLAILGHFNIKDEHESISV